ncbi:MAG TPA: hypothetical protein VGH44_04280 [Candidatus Saccharimonadia bacterium]|jgi:hypothetical protein
MADETPTQVESQAAEPALAPESQPAEQETAAQDVTAEPTGPTEAAPTATESAAAPDELEEARANEVAFSWQASEYVHHHKGPEWYAALAGALAILILAAVLLHLWVEIALFTAMGAAVAVYAHKPPRTLTYELTPQGVTIEGKQYPFDDFRSFGVVKDEEWHTIDLEPMKRLAPRLSVLFDPEDFDSVVGHLELHLPRADRDPDPIEKLSRYLRF